MSLRYDQYLEQHKENVVKGFNYLRDNLPNLASLDSIEHQICFGHDASKYDTEEYQAYDAYFYGGNRSYEVVQNFRKAWLRHIHLNPHHWQYWILNNDEPDEGEIILEMPYNYLIEMICDWWAFSWAEGDLTEIFQWYDKHKDYMKLAPKTREMVEIILEAIQSSLDSGKEKSDGRS